MNLEHENGVVLDLVLSLIMNHCSLHQSVHDLGAQKCSFHFNLTSLNIMFNVLYPDQCETFLFSMVYIFSFIMIICHIHKSLK
jgi:hypothetical protein